MSMYDDETPLCERFPEPWADRMWGFDDEGVDAAERRDLLRAGARICEQCPFRLECLAKAIVLRSRTGLSGGMSKSMRGAMARIAERDGVACRDKTAGSDSERIRRLIAWLELHPEAFDTAREEESERRKERRHAVATPKHRVGLARRRPKIAASPAQQPLF